MNLEVSRERKFIIGRDPLLQIDTTFLIVIFPHLDVVSEIPVLIEVEVIEMLDFQLFVDEPPGLRNGGLNIEVTLRFSHVIGGETNQKKAVRGLHNDLVRLPDDHQF